MFYGFEKVIFLALISVITVIAFSWVIGVKIKKLWKLAADGSMRELLTPEGRLCLLIGALFGSIILICVFTSELVPYIARMIDPQNFTYPKETPHIIFLLLFLYFIGNVIGVALLYRRN